MAQVVKHMLKQAQDPKFQPQYYHHHHHQRKKKVIRLKPSVRTLGSKIISFCRIFATCACFTRILVLFH
jgi:hypothetical protein